MIPRRGCEAAVGTDAGPRGQEGLVGLAAGPRSRASGWTASPVTNAMRSAVSRARCIGLVYRVCTPRPYSHRPVRLACRRPAGVSPGSPGTGSFSPCCTR
jgi:hypothetical protein